jgi:phage shock protein C
VQKQAQTASRQPRNQPESAMSEKKLRRSRQNRMIAGVVGGLAEYYDLDVTVLRIIYVLVSIFSAAFPGIIVYLILWAIMPPAEE